MTADLITQIKEDEDKSNISLRIGSAKINIYQRKNHLKSAGKIIANTWFPQMTADLIPQIKEDAHRSNTSLRII